MYEISINKCTVPTTLPLFFERITLEQDKFKLIKSRGLISMSAKLQDSLRNFNSKVDCQGEHNEIHKSIILQSFLLQTIN